MTGLILREGKLYLSNEAGDRLLTIKEVAEILNVSDSTVRRLVRNKELEAHKIGRQYRFAPDLVDDFIESCATMKGEKND